MFLDTPQQFAALDPEGMLGHIDALPDQFESAWALAPSLPLPDSFREARQIVITGMGGSAIGGDYLAALVEDRCPIPLIVNRGYALPAFAHGAGTAVIASSHSGNTEETLAAFDQALERGVSLMAVTTGGELARRARQAGVPLWTFTYPSQPRAALGWSFGLLVGLAHRLNLAGDLSADVAEALSGLRQGRDHLKADTPLHQNPAKRLAGQLCGRIGVFYGGGIMAPVARRWKCQVNENAKSWAEFDFLPEQNHNGVAGLEHPQQGIAKLFCVFLQSSFDHPRVTLRQELSYRLYLQEGVTVDKVQAQGTSRLAQMMSATQFGDYVSFYLAMENRVNPTPIPAITALKEGLTAAK
jgi:glucose/mannose-6-phosphate isomerase